MPDPIHDAAYALKDETVATRRDFHQHPEIAFEEVRTAGIVAERLRNLGLAVRDGLGKTGVVAVLDSGKPGRTVLARADMDALPVPEEKEVAYRSSTPGKMHACGHDGHTAVLLSVAKLLAAHKEHWDGKVVFVFQPAEEIVRGAEAMLQDGALEGLKPDASIGLHLSSMHPTGSVAFRSGPAMAATDTFHFVVQGRGGHAARPQECVDPIVIASQLVLALQTLVSREVDPVDQAVVSVTSVHGGTAFNIIPETVELKGTLRTFSEYTRSTLKSRILQLAEGIARAQRGELASTWREGSPAVVNDEAMTERFYRVAAEVVGEEKIVTADKLMGGDDMALWLKEAPGCYFFVGARNESKGAHFPHHHPRFDIDEDALPLAVELLAKGVLGYLQPTN